MAKYNLLEDDDIFDEEDDFSGKEDKEKAKIDPEPEPDQPEDIDINIDDDILGSDQEEDIPLDEDLSAEKSMKSTILDEEQQDAEIPVPEPEKDVQEFEAAAQEADEPQESPAEKPFITEDFEDEKQAGINYKPIIITLSAIIAVVLIYFLVDIFVLSDESDTIADQKTEQPVKTPEQIRQEQEAARKREFLSQLAGKTGSDINNISAILDNVQNSAKLSTILFYKESLLFEVFGTDRSDVAKVNINLKNKMSEKSFTVVSSQSRPGPNGGVFVLFKAETTAGGTGGSKNAAIKFNSISDAQNWLKQQTGGQGLKVKSIDNYFVGDDNNFKKYNLEATVNGSLNNCKNLLGKISSDGSQLRINKLNISAADQQNFQSNNYQLKLVLEIFV